MIKQTTQFECIVRGNPLHIDACATGDQYGIYALTFTAWMDGADVTGLLTDDDVMNVESEALQAFAAQHSDDVATKGY